jgi:hypothetical protein
MNRLRDKKDSTGALVTKRIKVVFLIGVILICVIIPTIATELTYKEYARESETWRRGFLLGIAQYLSAVAPDEEPPYHVRNAYQRCLSGATDSTLVRQLDSTSGEPVQARRSRSSASLYGQSSSCAGRKSRRSNRPNLYAVGEQSPANETIDRVLEDEETEKG